MNCKPFTAQIGTLGFYDDPAHTTDHFAHGPVSLKDFPPGTGLIVRLAMYRQSDLLSLPGPGYMSGYLKVPQARISEFVRVVTGLPPAAGDNLSAILIGKSVKVHDGYDGGSHDQLDPHVIVVSGRQFAHHEYEAGGRCICGASR